MVLNPIRTVLITEGGKGDLGDLTPNPGGRGTRAQRPKNGRRDRELEG